MPPTCTRLNDSFRTIFEWTCILDAENIAGLYASRCFKQLLRVGEIYFESALRIKKSNEGGVKWSIARSIKFPISWSLSGELLAPVTLAPGKELLYPLNMKTWCSSEPVWTHWRMERIVAGAESNA